MHINEMKKEALNGARLNGIDREVDENRRGFGAKEIGRCTRSRR